MLLRHKKIQDSDQNWCIILSPLRNEIDKKKVVQKIAQVFSLSAEEAQDLVANTPIILLDNLDRPTAIKVKEYFKPLGAEMSFTNDVFQKRKCYRTIWPEPPDLSFLGGWPQLSGEKENNEQELLRPLEPEDALNEIRSFVREDPKSSQPAEAVFQSSSAEERAKHLEEISYWKEQCEIVREQVQHLKEEMKLSRASSIEQDAYLTLQKEFKEIRNLLASAQENHRILQEEYRMACELYEDKCSAMAKDAESLKKTNQELGQSLETLRREKQASMDQWRAQENQFSKIAQEERQAYLLLEHKLSELNLQISESEKKNKELSEKNRSIEKEKQDLSKALEFKDGQYKKLSDDYDSRRRVLEEKLSQTVQEMEQGKLQIRGLLEKTGVLLKAKESLEQTINEQAEQVIDWRDKQNEAGIKLTNLERDYESEKSLKASAQMRQRELEDGQKKMAQQFEAKDQELHKLEALNQELIREIAGLQERRENLEKTTETAVKQLEVRERELEAARRQIREINAHAEQRELIQRKAQIANQLIEKETLLKKLIQDQEKVETEIRERESVMSKILSEQEGLEKEIIEAKQTQRHLTEQTKKEQRPNRPPLSPESNK